MARLQVGKKSQREQRVYHALHKYIFGIRESELANELGWNRRTLNNYLRKLEYQQKIYKDGCNWYYD